MKNKNMESWTHPAFSFPWVTPGMKTQNIWSSFLHSFFCARPFDQQSRVLIDLFLLFTHDQLVEIYGLLSFFLSFVNDNSTKNYIPHWFISFIYTPFDQNIWPSFIYSFFSEQEFNQKLWFSWIFFFFRTRPFDQNIYFSFIYSFSFAQLFH